MFVAISEEGVPWEPGVVTELQSCLWQKGLLVLEQRSCQGSVPREQFER